MQPTARGERWARVVGVAFALPSFPLALWLMIDPESFWGPLGLGGSPFTESLYGGAIFAEGVLFALAARSPRRYGVFFEYVVVYKAASVGAAALRVLSMAQVPLAAWAVLAGWASAGVGALAVVWAQRRA